jgi:hypothetical protein
MRIAPSRKPAVRGVPAGGGNEPDDGFRRHLQQVLLQLYVDDSANDRAPPGTSAAGDRQAMIRKHAANVAAAFQQVGMPRPGANAREHCPVPRAGGMSRGAVWPGADAPGHTGRP